MKDNCVRIEIVDEGTGVSVQGVIGGDQRFLSQVSIILRRLSKHIEDTVFKDSTEKNIVVEGKGGKSAKGMLQKLIDEIEQGKEK